MGTSLPSKLRTIAGLPSWSVMTRPASGSLFFPPRARFLGSSASPAGLPPGWVLGRVHCEPAPPKPRFCSIGCICLSAAKVATIPKGSACAGLVRAGGVLDRPLRPAPLLVPLLSLSPLSLPLEGREDEAASPPRLLPPPSAAAARRSAAVAATLQSCGMHHAMIVAHAPSEDKVVGKTAAAALLAAVRVEQRVRVRCQAWAGTKEGTINPEADRAS